MWEYEVIAKEERFFIWGYNFSDACRRHNLIEDDVTLLFQEYID